MMYEVPVFEFPNYRLRFVILISSVGKIFEIFVASSHGCGLINYILPHFLLNCQWRWVVRVVYFS
jgi:hypothetical protein